MKSMYLFLCIFLYNVLFIFYKAKFMPSFKRGFPDEYVKAGSPSWYLEGFNTTTFWVYLAKSRYRSDIGDPRIVKFLDRVKILYVIDVALFLAFMVSIELEPSAPI